MNANKDLKKDAVFWVIVMFVAALTAFGLLRRDAQRSFGAVSFGAFPDLNSKTTDGATVDRHLLKSRLWVIHAGFDPQKTKAMAEELADIQKRMDTHKRHLYILTVLESSGENSLSPLSPFHYITHSDGQQRGALYIAFGPSHEGTVLLVDQDAIIRGRYDIHDVDGLRAFQGDVRRLL